MCKRKTLVLWLEKSCTLIHFCGSGGDAVVVGTQLEMHKRCWKLGLAVRLISARVWKKGGESWLERTAGTSSVTWWELATILFF